MRFSRVCAECGFNHFQEDNFCASCRSNVARRTLAELVDESNAVVTRMIMGVDPSDGKDRTVVYMFDPVTNTATPLPEHGAGEVICAVKAMYGYCSECGTLNAPAGGFIADVPTPRPWIFEAAELLAKIITEASRVATARAENAALYPALRASRYREDTRLGAAQYGCES